MGRLALMIHMQGSSVVQKSPMGRVYVGSVNDMTWRDLIRMMLMMVMLIEVRGSIEAKARNLQEAQREHETKTQLTPPCKVQLENMRYGQGHNHEISHHIQSPSRHVDCVSIPAGPLNCRIPIVSEWPTKKKGLQHDTHGPYNKNDDGQVSGYAKALRAAEDSQVEGYNGSFD
jgi:hypothetical protein